MKIAVTGTRGIPNILGGIETQCEELFPRIAAYGHEVVVMRRKSYCNNDNITEYKGVTLIDIVAPKKKYFEAIIHTFRAIRKAKKLNADIVHIHAIGPALLTPFARLLGLKVVFTHHGPDYDRDKWGKSAKLMLKFGERIGVKYANEVIVISKGINQIIQKKYNRNDASLIYNGVPTPNIIKSTRYLEKLGVKSQKYIFAMGRFVVEKNFHHLIKAFSSLDQNEYQLVLAGDVDFEDDYSSKLKKLAEENNVVLTGFVKGEKLYSLLSHASVFVLPSSHEGLPIALLEAMSYQLPVLVSDIPANLEVGLEVDSYFPVGNESILAAKLELLMNKRGDKINYPMEKFNWDAITEQVIEVYERL